MSKVSPADEGEYICQVSAYKPSDLTHKLAVRGETDSLLVQRESTTEDGIQNKIKRTA
jgi:hypothetical protein